MSKSASPSQTPPGLREKAEEQLKSFTKKGNKRAKIDIEHELNVHEIELQMQNEELIATQGKLITSAKEYEALFEFSPTGYFILDKNGIIEKVNERGSAQMGLGKKHLIGKPFSIFLNGEMNQDNFYRHRNLVMETEELHHLECEIKRNDGSIFIALMKSAYIQDEQLNFKHLLSIVSDISKIKEHELQLELALTKSKELNDLKSRFISMASHEFRTPLSAILSSTWLVEQYLASGQEENLKRHLNKIRASVLNLTTILEEFLSLEKIESGGITVVKESFNLPIFFKEIIEGVRGLLKKGQFINFKHAGIENIYEDKKVLKLITMNLLSNACKYSAEGQEIIFNSTVSDKSMSILIKDFGIGIPEAEQKNIYTKFFRAHNASNIQGTGLGLNIAKKYTELLGGTINFTSRSNEGTTFIVTVPTSAYSS